MDAASLFDVKGKVVLVTGGGRGVGEMIAAGFVANGAKVYISSRSAKQCEDTAQALTKTGPGQCIAIPGDLQKLEDCTRVVAEIQKKEKALHVLINNSGATWGAPLESYPDEAFTKLLTLNVQRVFTMTQQLAPLLAKGAEQDGVGRVINIGSINGVDVPGLETYAYSASKAAVHQLSRHLANRLGPKGITVNALALGPFRSKMTKSTFDAFEEAISQELPMGRIGKPEDVVGACLYLSSRAGAWVTGATLPVDGGSLVMAKSKL